MKWNDIFKSIQQEIDFSSLQTKLEEKYKNGVVYPPREEIYTAFQLLPFKEVKVVIIGQDPYHGYGQAHGLAFSVRDGVKIPPSLVNIYKELYSDVGVTRSTGDLSDWARKGVLLLNTTLTVDESSAGSHKQLGWVPFTDAIIKSVSDYHEHVVFILWGKPAQIKEVLIDTGKHLVIKNVHPSPLSAYRGFFGSRPFSETNRYLIAHGKEPIEWSESY